MPEARVYVNQGLDDLCRLTDVWASGQKLLPRVTRWEQFLERGACRTQNTLQHSYSLALLGSIIRLRLSRYLPDLNWQLLQDCLLVHDHGEGELQQDTLYHNKNDAQDLREYEAFCKRYSQLELSAFEWFHDAFLLQFCLRNPANFPRSVRDAMEVMKVTCRREALLFDAIERFDYVLYAWEQYQTNNNIWLLVGVLHLQLPRLNELCNMVSGFDVEVWTREIREDMQKVVDNHHMLLDSFLAFIGRPDLK